MYLEEDYACIQNSNNNRHICFATIIVNSAAAAEEQIKDVTNTSVVKCNARDLLNKMRWSAGTAW